MKQAADTLADLGGRVEEIRLTMPEAAEVFETLWTAGAASALASFAPEQRRIMDPDLVAMAEAGAALSAVDYLAAAQKRAMLGTQMKRFHQSWDLLVMPALPIPAFEEAGTPGPVRNGHAWADWTPFTYPFNLTQQPACAMPCGLTRSGLPVALQIVGPMHADALVLRAARALETVMPIALPPDESSVA